MYQLRFACRLLDTPNKHFQNTLGITHTCSSGLQAAYFGAYPLALLGYTNAVGAMEVWIPSNIYLQIDIVWDRSAQ